MRLIRPSTDILPHLDYNTVLFSVVQAIGLCYGKRWKNQTQKEKEEIIRKRIKSGHESVIEHVGFSAKIITDRGISHELVRHRLCAFTQESTRFCNYVKEEYGNHITFVMPEFIAAVLPVGECMAEFITGADDSPDLCFLKYGQNEKIAVEDPAIACWINAMACSEALYMTVTANNLMPAEFARGMLPNALKTELVMSANMREWRHIFKLRAKGTTGRPHPQMVEIMAVLFEKAKERFPVFFEDL